MGDSSVFRVEDGAIVGETTERDIVQDQFLCTTRTFTDFELRLKVRLRGEDPHGGVLVRSRRVPGSAAVSGYRVDLGQQTWGCLNDASSRDRVLAEANAEVVAGVLRPDDWNDYRIRCEGRRTQIWLNGELTVDYLEQGEEIDDAGVIGLEIHSGKPCEAWYKDIRILELPAKEVTK